MQGRRVGPTSPYFSFINLNSSGNKESVDSSPFPVWQKNDSSFLSNEHAPPVLNSEERQDLVNDREDTVPVTVQKEKY